MKVINNNYYYNLKDLAVSNINVHVAMTTSNGVIGATVVFTVPNTLHIIKHLKLNHTA